jgi:hypothetical protein
MAKDPIPTEKKKPYVSPSLTEYGSVTKLTEAMGGSFADAMGGRAMMEMMEMMTMGILGL